MIRNYLKIAWRNVMRQPGYALINVVGLGVGIACCLLIALFVHNELAYDRHHEHGERIVRVTTEFSDAAFAVTANVVGPTLKREAPQVEEFVRFFHAGTFGPSVVRYGERMFEEDRFVYADSTVFDVFTFPLASGDPSRALTRPGTVVLTEPMARKYFGDADPMGQTIFVNQNEFEVTGVLAPLTAPSHVEFDFLASFESLSWATNEIWTGANFLTYLLLRDSAARETLPAQIDRILTQARAAELIPGGFRLPVEPLHTIHLDVGERWTYVYLFSAIALLILLIACVNYMNLATAQATRRAKEIGVRKVNGAHRRHLVAQFYGESALFTFFGLLLGVMLAYVLLPGLEVVSDTALRLPLGAPLFWMALLALGGSVTLVAGSYPALLLASLRPSQVLKGQFSGASWVSRFRKGLVVLQFAVSIFLLIGTAVIFSQLRYVQTTDLGFRGEQVIAMPMGDLQSLQALPTVKQRLQQEPGIIATAAIDRLPGTQPGGYGLLAEGFEMPRGMDYFPIHAIPTDADVVETLGIEIIAGEGFRVSEDYQPAPGEYRYLINEATLGATDWTAEEAIGKRMTVSGDGRWGTVVGVFRDYHFLPMHEAVGPLALFLETDSVNNLLVRIDPAALPAALARVEAVWHALVPHRPFTYTFLDDAFAAHYEHERQLGRLFGAFALLAMLIACLGLFGLSSFSTQQRIKEIGVRKVLGASIAGIVALLSKDFLKLVVIAFVIAAPLAYIAMSRWLDDFAYRIELGPGFFAIAGVLALAIALLTVSYHAVRAALSDPAKSLRYE